MQESNPVKPFTLCFNCAQFPQSCSCHVSETSYICVKEHTTLSIFLCSQSAPSCSPCALRPAPRLTALFKSVRVLSNQNKARGFLQPRTGRVCSVKSIDCAQCWLTRCYPTLGLQSFALILFFSLLIHSRPLLLGVGYPRWAFPGPVTVHFSRRILRDRPKKCRY